MLTVITQHETPTWSKQERRKGTLATPDITIMKEWTGVQHLIIILKASTLFKIYLV